MTTLNPLLASELALGSYNVVNNFKLRLFLESRNEFSNETGDSSQSYGEVGSRLFNVADAFGVCVKGTGIYKNDLFLIFRGSTNRNYGADWISNGRAGVNTSKTGSLVHIGFNQIFNSMTDQLARFLNAHRSAHTVHCIGHSLGGAVANLAADWIADHYSFNVKLYTFGAPRVGFGNGGFASKLSTKLLPENIYRVFHSTDPVPMVPLFPFLHAPASGQAYYVPFSGLTINISAHSMENYIQSVGGHTWNLLYQPAPNFSKAAIRHWLEGDTESNPHSVGFWNRLHYAALHIVQGVLTGVGIAFSGVLTIADYMAILLKKGVELAGEISHWVFLFARKIMRALGMKVVESVEELTIQLLRNILRRIIGRIAREATKAIERL